MFAFQIEIRKIEVRFIIINIDVENLFTFPFSFLRKTSEKNQINFPIWNKSFRFEWKSYSN